MDQSQAFNFAEYTDALRHAVTYGLMVLCTMLVVGAILTLASGGTAAKNWVSGAAEH